MATEVIIIDPDWEWKKFGYLVVAVVICAIVVFVGSWYYELPTPQSIGKSWGLNSPFDQLVISFYWCATLKPFSLFMHAFPAVWNFCSHISAYDNLNLILAVVAVTLFPLLCFGAAIVGAWMVLKMFSIALESIRRLVFRGGPAPDQSMKIAMGLGLVLFLGPGVILMTLHLFQWLFHRA